MAPASTQPSNERPALGKVAVTVLDPQSRTPCELNNLALFGRTASECTKAGVIAKVDEEVANQ